MSDIQGDFSVQRTALVYLARGADDDSHRFFEQFVRAYHDHRAGLPHELVVIFKGFSSDAALERARAVFAPLVHQEIYTPDDAYDIGAYASALPQIAGDRICFLNTKSEPAAQDWLLKLAANLQRPGVGLVGATGSFYSHRVGDIGFPPFPNVHVRSNAFMMRARHARGIIGSFKIGKKRDAYLAESGSMSITRQVFAAGLTALVVGRNGRGYAPEWWRTSQTLFQGSQSNLLVHDNQTRRFEHLPRAQKQLIYDSTWGDGKSPGKPFHVATP